MHIMLMLKRGRDYHLNRSIDIINYVRMQFIFVISYNKSSIKYIKYIYTLDAFSKCLLV